MTSINTRQPLDAKDKGEDGFGISHTVDLEASMTPTEGEITIYDAAHEFDLAEIRAKYSFLSRLHIWEEYLGGRVGMEAMGIERVPEDKRQSPGLVNMVVFWFTMNLNPGFLVIGALGVALGLSINETMAISFSGAAIASIAPAWAATLCPPTGLRQIAVSRFTFGIWGAKICSIVNCVINVGFGVSNAIVGRSAACGFGIIIIVLIAWIISFFGFRVLHTVFKYAWIPPFVLICSLWGQSAKYWSSHRDQRFLEGTAHTGGCLTFFALVFGSTIAWSTMAGDYYVHYPANVSKKLVFLLTYAGLLLPYSFCLPLGVLLGGSIATNEALAAIYGTGNIGEVIQAIMTPKGWGNTACIFFFLSMIGNQSAISYSCALSIQLLSKYSFAVPRFIWSTLISALCLGLAWGGRNSLAAIISNFSSMLGYYVISFVACMAMEHYLFRPRLGGYDAERWRDPKVVPLGIAGTVTLLGGFGLAFAGMTQTWFIGPLALMVSPYGGDLGDYLVMGNCLIMYPVLRYLEIRNFGR